MKKNKLPPRIPLAKVDIILSGRPSCGWTQDRRDDQWCQVPIAVGRLYVIIQKDSEVLESGNQKEEVLDLHPVLHTETPARAVMSGV